MLHLFGTAAARLDFLCLLPDICREQNGWREASADHEDGSIHFT
jgi:hypothetical protein